MKRFTTVSIFFLVLFAFVAAAQKPRVSIYYPEPGDKWQRKAPAEVGMDAALLDRAIEYAKSRETRRPRDYSDQVEIFGRPLGPLPRSRGGTNGIVIRHGYIVAEFGDTSAVEPTYSVAKSFVSTVLGLAIDRGLIKDVNDPVRMYVKDAKDNGYDSPHNAKVTWHHHARQTSEWEGEMFGKPHTFLGVEEFGRGKREPRELKDPGSFYEYNDVRINRFSLSLLRVWKKPLPLVLKDEVMDRIGASSTWQYHPYANSEVEVAGKKMWSVSGGTRWGGGLWINTRDEARFGYLFLRRGKWGDRQIISERWVKMATTPGEHGPDYGYLWWLNTQRKQWPDAPASSFAAVGFGSNTIWVDPDHDLVVVWRWHNDRGANEFYKRILASIQPANQPAGKAAMK
jgi:CubicO group peptidase (beta-lactamase class C family)